MNVTLCAPIMLFIPIMFAVNICSRCSHVPWHHTKTFRLKKFMLIFCKRKKNPKYATNVTIHLCNLHSLQITGELISADKALIVVHQMLQGLFISATPQVYGYLQYALANGYHYFQPLMPKFILIIMGNHGGLYVWPVRRPFAITHHLIKGLNLYNKC